MVKTTAELWEKDNQTRICGLGMIKSIQDNMSASNITVPIVTFTAENTFTMDIKGTESISISFERTNDTNDGNFVDDPSAPGGKRKMNNAEWISILRAQIDQWQAKHDGYILKYYEDPEDPEYTGNLAPIVQSGYIKSFSTNFVCGKPEYISGTLVFQPGSIRAKNGSVTTKDEEPTPTGFGQSVEMKKVYIFMTSSDQTATYPLHTIIYDETGQKEIDTISCVSSYEYTCGPLDPFPYMKITLSKKRMMTIAPDLVNDVVAGKNIIYFNACGNGTMIVTKCSLNNSNYTLTAYAPEEIYRGTTVGKKYDNSLKPLYIIYELLKKQFSIGSYKFNYDQKRIIFDLKGRNPIDIVWGGEVEFSEESTIWHVISICALRMGCSVWFMNGYVYFVDIPAVPDDLQIEGDNYHIYDCGKVMPTTYLNAVPGIPEEGTLEHFFCESVQNTPSLGDEGNDAFANSIVISYSEKNDKGKYENKEISTRTDRTDDYYVYINKSYNAHGLRGGESINLPEIKNTNDAQTIADYYPIVTADPQQSITFTLSETTPDGKRWHSYFAPLSYLTKIVDFNTDTIVNNQSSYFVQDGDIKKKETIPYKLFLASMTRKFPEFSTEYTFGRLKNADLSQTTSEIKRALGK